MNEHMLQLIEIQELYHASTGERLFVSFDGMMGATVLSGNRECVITGNTLVAVLEAISNIAAKWSQE